MKTILQHIQESIVENKAENMPHTQEAAEQWVNAGKPCTYTYGWSFKGAGAKPISTAEAKEKLKKHSFGKGFYTLWWEEHNGKLTLNFNELSANDMY